MSSTTKEVHSVIKRILADERAYRTSLNYAVGYCRAGLTMSGHELKVQTLYILNNITHWRHADAKLVRKVLKEYKEEMKAVDHGDCPLCGEKVLDEFRDALSKREYEISGMCQSCQDDVFGRNESE